LHILFTNFVRIVEDMFTKIMAIPIDVEPDIPAHFGPGVDPAFDKVLNSLGHIGSHKPTPVINTLMYWRAHKVKPEGAADGTTGSRSFTPTPANVPAGAVAAINAGTIQSPAMMPLASLPSSGAQLPGSTPPALIRRQTEPVSINMPQGQEYAGQYMNNRAAMTQRILKDRQKNCTVYTLCRALIEVIKHTTADALTDDVASRIEPIVFRELSNQDPEVYYRGKSNNWNIFAELLGCFSNIRYLSVKSFH
jgi:hypothetical protein